LNTYHLVVFEAEEGGFWADVAELPGCVAQGESLDELLGNARDAIEVFLEVMAEEGEEPIGDRFVANLEVATPAG
jgi:predicted RNase H-like HicB family nuclease